MQLQSWQVCTPSLVGLLIWWIAPTEFSTSSYSQAFVNGSSETYSPLIRNGSVGSGNLAICNGGAAMYSQAMHNGDIDQDECSLRDLLGVASSASMNQKQIYVALLGFISFFFSPQSTVQMLSFVQMVVQNQEVRLRMAPMKMIQAMFKAPVVRQTDRSDDQVVWTDVSYNRCKAHAEGRIIRRKPIGQYFQFIIILFSNGSCFWFNKGNSPVFVDSIATSFDNQVALAARR